MILSTRSRHPNKDIEDSIQYAESKKWRFKSTGGSSHAWGKLLCLYAKPSGCIICIYCTPKNPTNYAKLIKRQVDKCPH